jgi:hypothetical protein
MGSKDLIPLFLTSALGGDQWSASQSCRFTPGEEAPGTHCIEGWVAPEPVWRPWRREKSLAPAGRGWGWRWEVGVWGWVWGWGWSWSWDWG